MNVNKNKEKVMRCITSIMAALVATALTGTALAQAPATDTEESQAESGFACKTKSECLEMRSAVISKVGEIVVAWSDGVKQTTDGATAKVTNAKQKEEVANLLSEIPEGARTTADYVHGGGGMSSADLDTFLSENNCSTPGPNCEGVIQKLATAVERAVGASGADGTTKGAAMKLHSFAKSYHHPQGVVLLHHALLMLPMADWPVDDDLNSLVGRDGCYQQPGQDPVCGKVEGADGEGFTINGETVPWDSLNNGGTFYMGTPPAGSQTPYLEALAAGEEFHGRDKANPENANQETFAGLEGREAEAVFRDGRPSVVGPIGDVSETGLRVGETPVTYEEIESGEALVFIGRTGTGTGSGGPADSGVAGDGRLDLFGMYLNGAYGFGVGGDISNVPGVEAGVLLKPWAGPFFVRAGAVLSTVNGMTPYATEDVDDRGTFSAKLGLGLQMDLSNTMALITGVNGLANEAGAGGSVDLLARINLGSVGLFGGINAFHGTLPASLGRDPLRLENPDSTTGSVLSLVIGADLPVIVRSQ